MPTCISHNGSHLYCELSGESVSDLIGDILARYEGLFMFSDPVYPQGKAQLLFSVLRGGYGLAECARGVGIDLVDLDTAYLEPNETPNDDWKEPFAGRILARTFASTLL